MADEVNVSIPSSSPLLSPTSTVTSDNIPALPITANFFQSSSDPSIPTIPTLSSLSTLDNPQSSPKAHSPPRPALIPIPIIAGAAGGVVLFILAIVTWYCLRRRRQNRRVSNPELSYDSRKESPQDDNNDNNNNKKEGDGRVSIDSFPGLSPVQRPRDLECGLPSSNNNSSSSDNYTYNPRPSFSAARSPPPPPVVSHSVSIPMRETSLYPVPEGSHEQQTNHTYIDMTSLDTLMPIVVSDEIKPVVQSQQDKVVQDASKSLACIQPATTIAAAATATTEHKPRASTDTIMPTPVLRRPKLTVRRSTDSFIQGGRARISMCLPPPPPPPTIPPPAIPITNPGDSGYGGGRGRVSTESSSCRSSIYSTHPTAGRRTRSSTESSRVAYSRRSVSMDASSAGDGRRLSRRVILPPTIPPPPVPLPPPPPIPVPVPTPSPTSSVPSTPTHVQQFQPQHHVAPPPRRRHQRNPSQILNTSLFDSSDRSAISPPLSPLTIQIPRPSSRSFQSLLTINTQLTAENVQQYLQQQQPAPLEIAKPDSPTDSVAAPSPRTTSLYHSPRSRRKSTSQIETHRIMIPPSAASMTSPTSSTFSPPVPPLPPVPAMPAMPTLFESYHPSSPSSTSSSSQSCISLKRPSLSHQMSSSSLDSTRTDNTASTSVNARIDIHHYHHHYHDNNDNGADDSHRYQYHHNYHDGRHSAEPKKRQQQKQQRRRSMSLPSSPSSPSSSSQVESKEDFASAIVGTSNTATATATKDQELQAIIADAIAIAAAKTAAIESARQNAFHRQMQVKYQQHQQQQRRLYPSQIDPWRSTTPSPSTLDSSRPESPL